MNGKEVLVARKKRHEPDLARVYVNVGCVAYLRARVALLHARYLCVADALCTCVGCRAHLQRTRFVLQPLFGAAAVLPPTRFCRESCAYCVCKATLLARTCHFPFSKSILAPCAPPVQSTTSTLLRPGPYTFHRAPLCRPVSFSANIYSSIARVLARSASTVLSNRWNGSVRFDRIWS